MGRKRVLLGEAAEAVVVVLGKVISEILNIFFNHFHTVSPLLPGGPTAGRGRGGL